MKKINIQNDLDSRREISLAGSVTFFKEVKDTNVESLNSEQDGESKNIQECEDIQKSGSGSEKKVKRGRKTQGDSETLSV
ncbi:hypothetical protein DW228_05905 [Bacteroides fragilis]|uniref:Uncharacterized protein n=1 Tax=Bacteroides fragilis TaxID=817 RepID=A0A396C7S6_BACFG|nr:hypothetical protein [Bacteroides fragilis]RHH14330.1 hypothetical protein DW228_05905 [Bacteroides fragilis]